MGFLGLGRNVPSGLNAADANPPARQDRQKCWERRDAYYSCLDTAGVLVPGEESNNNCAAELKSFEKNCAKSWIDYFNQRRVLAERQKDSLAMANAQQSEAKQTGKLR